MFLPFRMLMVLLLLVAVIALQVYLSRRKAWWPGLVLPVLEVASCLYTQIPESRINTELFNHHQKTEYPYNHTENAF